MYFLNKHRLSFIAAGLMLFTGLNCSGNQAAWRFNGHDEEDTIKTSGAYYTGHYPNLFVELLGKTPDEVQARIEKAWDQLFYGDDEKERLYYPVEPGMAYIKDIYHNYICSEGMSYGLMIAVQLDKKDEFNRLWTWAKTYMQHKNGPRKGYFAWLLNTNGGVMDPNSASDGEEYIVMALLFASARWGNGEGMYDYQHEAQAILDAMISKEEVSDSLDIITNMFNKTEKQVVFVPAGDASRFTDPSYHLPHFYELWAHRADKENRFWMYAALASRQFFKRTVHPKTGLMPDYARFDGTPIDLWSNGYHLDFRFDAWRTVMNIAVDHVWFSKDDWAVEQSNRYLDFFYNEGVDQYGNNYTLDGRILSADRSPGLIAMNATACLASTHEHRVDFVKALWESPVPDGLYRYYDGLLYMLGMLHVSGQFKIYEPYKNVD